MSIHDPTTGEWHDIPTKQAPKWAKNEAFKRSGLYKAGEKRFLTQSELEEVWRTERSESEEIVEGKGIVDTPKPVVDGKGIVFEDYLAG